MSENLTSTRPVEKRKYKQCAAARVFLRSALLGEWPGISQNGRRQAPPARCVPTIHMHHGWARRTRKISDVDSLF